METGPRLLQKKTKEIANLIFKFEQKLGGTQDHTTFSVKGKERQLPKKMRRDPWYGEDPGTTKGSSNKKRFEGLRR